MVGTMSGRATTRPRRRVVTAVLAGVLGLAAVATAAPSPAAFGGTSAGPASYTANGYVWKPVRLGGGGNVSGIGGADDGTLVARIDVYGAYVLDAGTSVWRQLVTAESMPAAWHHPKMGKGVEEVAVAPSDSKRIYLMWAGHLFVTKDGGHSFVETPFAGTNWDSNGGFGRGFGDRMAVDPADPDVVYAAGPNTALRATDNAGITWSDTTVPAGAVDPQTSNDTGGQIASIGITGIAFDRSSGTIGGRTKVAYAASWGNGVYRTADGGATWTLIGGPTEVEHAAIDSHGTYYVTSGDHDGPFTIQAYDTAWHDITPTDWNPTWIGDVENPFLAVNPSRAGQVVIGYANQMLRTDDGGTTWRALHWSDITGDVTWADNKGAHDPYLVASDLIFDTAHPGRMWLATGSGVQSAELPLSSDTFGWSERTRGMETMVATDVVSTRGSSPVFGVFDFGQFGGSRNLDNFSLAKGPVPYFSGTTSLDASPFATGFAVSVTTDYVQHGRYPINSAYTSNGGRTWTRFPTMPRGATSAAQFGYGTIAVSTPNNIVWAPGRYYPTESTDFQPYYTKDRGRTWKPVQLPGVTSYPADTIGGFMFGQNRQTVVADQVQRNVFYLSMLGNGVYRTTNGGDTWTQVHAGDLPMVSAGLAGLMKAMPGKAGNLFYTDGSGGGHDWQGPQQYSGSQFIRSRDGGATWEAVPDVGNVLSFGFGAPARGSRVAAIYLVGTVSDRYGIWQSIDDGSTWKFIGDYPYTIDWVTTVSGDMNVFGTVYIGFAGSSFVYGTPVKPTPVTKPTPTTVSRTTTTVARTTTTVRPTTTDARSTSTTSTTATTASPTSAPAGAP